ncbi:MAG TPA: P-type DNA transfer ATPase VirB11 [Deltaproteobacteria bacterium]|nr:MAG: P-type DNA transfer ATPase VirB11 [Deltaproteobacteria bacterium GWA2_45_12]HBF13534.1 P-type DNA transfer ATPase VirB11 [Deltaproteobacteria bacterium]
MSNVAIHTFLRPLAPFLNEKGVTEISINRPEEVWVEKDGEMKCYIVPALHFHHLHTLADLVAEYSDQEISEETPILSATLPGDYRVQIVLPPAVEMDCIAISIRKQALLDLTWDDYRKMKAFDLVNKRSSWEEEAEGQLLTLFRKGRYEEFLQLALLVKKNILISAGTSTGKTTFLNMCLKSIPQRERILTIEDAREVKVFHQNRVHLLASRGGQGLSNVTTQQLLEASLRLRPDRIIVGELRGAEAFTYLRAINSGHPGSLTTIHADTPELAFDQLALMVMQANLGMTRPQILEYIRSIIPIVIQWKRGEKGYRYISDIYYREAIQQ